MLYKPLFIIHVTVKKLLKSYIVVQKQSTSVTKVGTAHAYQAYIINTLGFKFQCRYNSLLYNLFSLRISYACNVQVLIYMHLLTITCLHNKAAVVTKIFVKSICLGVQF